MKNSYVTLKEIKEAYKKNEEAKKKDLKFAKKVKATFIIIPCIFLIAYFTFNVLNF